MAVVTVPGFGDTALYWAEPVARVLGDPSPVQVGWPGLWGRPAAEVPVQHLVEAVAARTDGTSVLVGHSFGARVVCAAAALSRPAAVVLLAPALSVPSFLQPAAFARWQEQGLRPTERPDPSTGESVLFPVPFAFAQDALDLASTVMDPLPVPALMVCMSSDDKQNEATAALVAGGALAGPVRVVDGPHRFWEHPTALADVVHAVSEWAWP